MKEYKVIYRATVKPYLDELGQYISEQTTPEFADRYLDKLRREVEILSIMAGMLPQSKYLMPLTLSQGCQDNDHRQAQIDGYLPH